MKVLDPGHKYELKVLDYTEEDTVTPEILTFVKREGEKYPGNVGHYPGTTFQEVLRALIDRLAYLDNQLPCWQNVISKACLILTLYMFELRNNRIKKESFLFIWDLNKPVNNVDGHIHK